MKVWHSLKINRFFGSKDSIQNGISSNSWCMLSSEPSLPCPPHLSLECNTNLFPASGHLQECLSLVVPASLETVSQVFWGMI